MTLAGWMWIWNDACREDVYAGKPVVYWSGHSTREQKVNLFLFHAQNNLNAIWKSRGLFAVGMVKLYSSDK